MQTLPSHRRRQTAHERYDITCDFMAMGERIGVAPSVTLKVLGIKSTGDKAFYDGVMQHYKKHRARYQKRVAVSVVSWVGPDGERHLTDPEDVPFGVSPELDRRRRLSIGKAIK
jgi:hypothetical protein